MGILKLNELLNEKSPRCFSEIILTTWRGKRIAVDISFVMHQGIMAVSKDVINKTALNREEPDRNEIMIRWLRVFKSFLFRLLDAGITPVIVFDGKPPPEKDETKKERYENKEVVRAQIDDLRQKINSYYSSSEIPNQSILEPLQKLYRKLPYIEKTEIEAVKGILSAIGIPWIQAPREADEVCAALFYDGHCIGTYTIDTDLLAHGCQFQITGLGSTYNLGQKVTTAEIVDLSIILTDLGVTFQQFQDICIALGCDYNEKLYRINPVDTYQLIKTCGYIENIPPKRKPELCKAAVCRELFRPKSLSVILGEEAARNLNLDINRDLDDMRDRLEMWNLSDWIPDLVRLYSNFPTPTKTVPNDSTPEITLIDVDGQPIVDANTNTNTNLYTPIVRHDHAQDQLNYLLSRTSLSDIQSTLSSTSSTSTSSTTSTTPQSTSTSVSNFGNQSSDIIEIVF